MYKVLFEQIASLCQNEELERQKVDQAVSALIKIVQFAARKLKTTKSEEEQVSKKVHSP